VWCVRASVEGVGKVRGGGGAVGGGREGVGLGGGGGGGAKVSAREESKSVGRERALEWRDKIFRQLPAESAP